MAIKLKQIDLPAGTSTTAVTDGQGLTGAEAAELIAGKDEANNAQFISTEADGRIRISIPSVQDAGNSPSGSLGPDDTITGVGVFVRDFAAIGVQAWADQDSAVDGLRFQWSQNNSNWDESLEFSVFANQASSYVVGPRADYFRVVYQNGSNFAFIRIQTNLHYSEVRAGTVRISDTINGELDAVVVKSSIAGKTTAGGGAYVDCKVSPAGALAVEGTVAVSALPLPAGAATEATLSTLALDSTLTDGTQKAIARGGAKGSTTAADVTSSASGANHQPLDVMIYDASGSPITSFGGGSADAVDGTAVFTAISQTADLPTPGKAYNILRITGRGTFSAQARVEVSSDNATWLTAYGIGTSLSATTVLANATSILYALSGYKYVRLFCQAYTSGTMNIDWQLSRSEIFALNGVTTFAYPFTNIVDLSGSVQPAGDVAGRAIFGKVTDGVRTAAVAPASTAATATDPALVVTISPNDATLTGGTAKSIVRGGAKGTTTAADVTSTSSGADHQVLDIGIFNGGGTGPAGVKAASTAPVFADPALVVTISPNTSSSLILATEETRSGFATPSNVTASTTSQLFFSSSSARRLATIYNDSTAVLYVIFGSGAASSTSFTVKMAPDSYYEVPEVFRGQISGVWATATGSARITQVP